MATGSATRKCERVVLSIEDKTEVTDMLDHGSSSMMIAASTYCKELRFRFQEEQGEGTRIQMRDSRHGHEFEGENNVAGR